MTARRWMSVSAMVSLITAGGCASQATQTVPEVVQAQRFVLVDESGARRAELESHDAVVSLTFYDERGEIRLLMALDGRRERTLILMNRADGGTGVQLGVEPAGEAVLGLAGAAGAPRIILGLDDSGSGLRLVDQNGVERADLIVAPEGGVAFTLRDADGQPRTQLPREAGEAAQ